MNNLVITFATKLLHLSPDLVQSQLFDDQTFYPQLLKDLRGCKKEIIIESPFIASTRMLSLLRTFETLVAKKVKIYVFTRNPEDHDLTMKLQAEQEIRKLETIGVQVIISGEYSHRKIAILDRTILYEGSLNILSQSCSREVMRKITSEVQANQMFRFLKLERFIY